MNEKNIYDAIIIGGGPAGLSAAIYLARARYRVLVLEKETFGGQITITSEVVNYPGIERTDGKYLTQVMRKQAENFGAEFSVAEVQDTDLTDDIKTVKTDKGVFSSFGVLIATGARPRTLGFPGEEKFKGHGVAYCATCDGEFFTGKEIFVIGGGFAAAEESVFLTRYAKHVTVLVREDDFTCAAAGAEKAKENPKITVMTNTEVVGVDGGEYPNKIIYKNNKNIYFRFNENGVLIVTCHKKVSKEEIKSLIFKNEDAIIKMYQKAVERKKYNESYHLLGKTYNVEFNESIDNVYINGDFIYAKNEDDLNKFTEEEINRVFNEEVSICKNCFNNLPEFTLKFRQMKTRWGVCNRRDNIITLNKELIKKEVWLLDYVIIHEMAHFYEGNHSKKFWNIVSLACPNYKEARKELRK